MSDDTVQKIKDRLSIVDVVGQYVQLQKAGRNYRARCPFHKERTPSFMVSPERGSYMCFGCGEKGDIFSFVEKIDGVDFMTVLRQFAEKTGVELPKHSQRTVESPEKKEKAERLREVCEAASVFFEETLAAREDVGEYIAKRGVTDDTRARWHIGYAPAAWEEMSKHLLAGGFTKDELVDAGLAVRSERKPGEIFDRFRGRIMFPLFDVNGRIIAFSGRFFEKIEGARDDGEPAKYVNSPETDIFKKSRALYGLNFAKEAMRKADCVLLVEGQFDVVLTHQSGLHFAVASSGTALTQEHLALLSRYSKRLVLALDNDEAGVRAGLRASAMALSMGFDVKIPTIEGGKDPADLAQKDPELLRAAVRSSQPAVEFFLDVLRPSVRDERAYKKLIEAQVLPLIAVIQSKIDQAHFIRIVAERLHVPEDAVRAEVLKRPASVQNVMSEVPAFSTAQTSAPEISSLEKTVGMLIFHFGPESSVTKQLAELLTAERLSDIEARLSPEAERLRFEFDEYGEGEQTTAEEFLTTIKRALFDEYIAAAREELRAAERTGDSTKQTELFKRITDWKRQKDALR